MAIASPRKSIIAIDFFCGAGGLTRGLLDSGIQVLAGIDNDSKLRKTYEHNNSPSKFVCQDVKDVNMDSLLKELKTKVRHNSLLYAACTPCQPFSTLNSGSKKNDNRRNLLLAFGELVVSHPPDFVLVENVPGINGKMKYDNKNILKKFHEQLRQSGFKYFVSELINAVDYGVPQERKRFILIAYRHGEIGIPAKLTSKKLTVRDAIARFPKPGVPNRKTLLIPNHKYRPLRLHHLQIIKAVPKNGGNRCDVKDTSILLKCHQNKSKCHKDVFGRMRWHFPAPTLTARCTDVYCGRFAHPVENRGITLREAAAIQTFNDDYEFFGSFQHCALQIGNAVPVELARQLGKHIIARNRRLS